MHDSVTKTEGSGNRPVQPKGIFQAILGLGLLALVGLIAGCAWNTNTARRVAKVAVLTSSESVQVHKRANNYMEKPINWWGSATGRGGIQPDDRTQLFLRTFALEQDFREDPESLLSEMRQSLNLQPDLERLHVLGNLAYVEGHRSFLNGNQQRAGQLLATAVSASYQYLFDPRLEPNRNAYDPVFRAACDTYNRALEGLLRIMNEQDSLRPGGSFRATTLDGKPLEVTLQVSGRWQNEEFEKFEFVADFSTQGVRNVHHTYGLGVPLIAIRKRDSSIQRAEEQYYPNDLSMPLTAFARTSFGINPMAQQELFDVRLIDPLEQTQVKVADQYAPLQSDITTPLAYFLADPLLDRNWFATTALLNGDFARQHGGLYMLEPFDKTKIPVVMVHGFWSSPMTWTEMFNDLRADKTLRDNYQFWFYLYPSGQPFWLSARQMREDLTEVRGMLDPDGTSASLNEMVLVGHSMGGLVSKLQTLDSKDDFWKLVSDRSINELKGSQEMVQSIRDTLFFNANPAISRVVTIATPHRGSQVANSLTRWVSQQLIGLPANLRSEYIEVFEDNPDFFRSDILGITTATDALSPDSAFFEAMLMAESDPDVIFHNIYGVHESSGPVGYLLGKQEQSDGVVAVSSAKSDNAQTSLQVNAEHSSVHQHPEAILEVRRILHRHLKDLYASAEKETPESPSVVRPAGFDDSETDPRFER